MYMHTLYEHYICTQVDFVLKYLLPPLFVALSTVATVILSDLSRS